MHESTPDIDNHFECVAIKLEPNEHLHMIVRKHWIILIESMALTLILLAVCAGAYMVAEFAHVPSIFTLLTIIGISMIGFQYIFIHWVNDELDVLILTNRRIITLDQINFLDRKLSQTTIDNVQEVNSSTSGLMGNIFEYGNMVIRTASDMSNDKSDFQITKIPHPIETSRKIHGYIDEYRHELGR